MPLTKQQLEVVNQTNFPNNTTGYISPVLLREFNTDIIDNTVNQTLYNADSSSVSAQLVGLNSYTQSLNTNFITSGSLNAATASLSASLTTTINTKLPTSTFNTYTSSTNGRLDTIETNYASKNAINTFTQNQIFQYSVNIGNDLQVVDQLSVTGSAIITGDITGSKLNITDNSLLGRNINTITRVSGSLITDILIIDGENFKTFSQSVVNGLNSGSTFPAFSTSVDSRLDSLEAFSSSLADTYATDIELAAVSVSLNLAKLNTSSFNSYSASAFSQSIFVSQSFSSSLSLLSSSFSSSLSSVSQSVSGTINILSTSVNSRLLATATTGSNSFVGNQRITGSLTISSSLTNDLIIIGQQVITSSVINSKTQLSSEGVNIDASADSTNTSISIGAFANKGSSVSLTLGVYDTPTYSTDVELSVNVDTGSGIVFYDWDNVSAANYIPFMSIAPNLGNNPPPVFNRGLTVSGSMLVSGSISVTGTYSFSGSLTITGSSNSNVVAITPASNTASIDMSKGNFFTLTIPSSSITLIKATNIKSGQTVGIRLSQQSTTGSVRFDTPFKFWSGSAQYNTGSAISGGVDLFTFMSFDTASLYTSAIKNLV
jgi:cytoskeletal protein CcmA (bactofilin family)